MSKDLITDASDWSVGGMNTCTLMSIWSSAVVCVAKILKMRDLLRVDWPELLTATSPPVCSVLRHTETERLSIYDIYKAGSDNEQCRTLCLASHGLDKKREKRKNAWGGSRKDFECLTSNIVVTDIVLALSPDAKFSDAKMK